MRRGEIGAVVHVFAPLANVTLDRAPLLAAWFFSPPHPPSAAAGRGTSGCARSVNEPSGWLVHVRKALEQTIEAICVDSLYRRRQCECALRVSRWR